ncbi:hypothetical protein L6R53_17855 [Myxococcota bacterium]|nr:hypothetical protein [Myxococcota bacterium]
MAARHLSLIALALVACAKGDTSFSAGQGDGTTQIGNGGMEVYPAEGLVWEGLVTGFPCSEYLRIESVGLEELNIASVDVTVSGDGVFTLPSTHEGISVAPGDFYELSVQATLSTMEAVTGELRIKSNDEENGDLRLPLTANPATDWDTGDTGQPPC